MMWVRGSCEAAHASCHICMYVHYIVLLLNELSPQWRRKVRGRWMDADAQDDSCRNGVSTIVHRLMWLLAAEKKGHLVILSMLFL